MSFSSRTFTPSLASVSRNPPSGQGCKKPPARRDFERPSSLVKADKWHSDRIEPPDDSSYHRFVAPNQTRVLTVEQRPAILRFDTCKLANAIERLGLRLKNQGSLAPAFGA